MTQNTLMRKFIGVGSFLAIIILSISAVPPTIPSIPQYATVEIVENQSGIYDTEYDALFSVTPELPESNDSFLVNLLDQTDSTAMTIDITRILGEQTSLISQVALEKSLSFITEENDFKDLTDTNLSYSFSIKTQDSIQYCSTLVEILINGEHFNEKRYDLKSIKNDVHTDTNTIRSLTTNDGIIKIELKIKELYIRTESSLYSLSEPIIIHSLILEKDSNQILYKSEDGKITKLYPNDDKIQFYSEASDVKSGGGCAESNFGVCLVFKHPTIYSFNPRPSMGVITITDELNNVVIESLFFAESSIKQTVGITPPSTGGSCGGECFDSYIAEVMLSEKILDFDLQRNSKYHIHIGSPNNIDFEIITPKSQKNYVFSCSAHGCNFPS